MDTLNLKLLELGFEPGVSYLKRGRVTVHTRRDGTGYHAEASIEGRMQWQTVSLEIRNRNVCWARNAFLADKESDIRLIKFDLQPGIEWFVEKVQAMGVLAC